MKKTIKTVALFIGLGMLAVSCQKESFTDVYSSVEEMQEYINVYYTIDGVDMQASFSDEESWQEFLNRMMALVKKGHCVSLRDSRYEHRMAKEVITFETPEQDEANKWSAQK